MAQAAQQLPWLAGWQVPRGTLTLAAVCGGSSPGGASRPRRANSEPQALASALPRQTRVEAPISNQNLSSELPRVTEAYPGSSGQQEWDGPEEPVLALRLWSRGPWGGLGRGLAVTPFLCRALWSKGSDPGAPWTLFGPASGLFHWRHPEATTDYGWKHARSATRSWQCFLPCPLKEALFGGRSTHQQPRSASWPYTSADPGDGKDLRQEGSAFGESVLAASV